MTKEQQDLAWTCLTKEARENISYSYKNSPCGSWIENLFEEIYGEHNLTSDTEPDEMLMVERKKVQEVFVKAENSFPYDAKYNVQGALHVLFGDKCLPDKKEQPNMTGSDLLDKMHKIIDKIIDVIDKEI